MRGTCSTITFNGKLWIHMSNAHCENWFVNRVSLPLDNAFNLWIPVQRNGQKQRFSRNGIYRRILLSRQVELMLHMSCTSQREACCAFIHDVLVPLTVAAVEYAASQKWRHMSHFGPLPISHFSRSFNSDVGTLVTVSTKDIWKLSRGLTWIWYWDNLGN